MAGSSIQGECLLVPGLVNWHPVQQQNQVLGPGCTCYDGRPNVWCACMCRSPKEPGSESLGITTVIWTPGWGHAAMEWQDTAVTCVQDEGYSNSMPWGGWTKTLAEQQQLGLCDVRPKLWLKSQGAWHRAVALQPSDGKSVPWLRTQRWDGEQQQQHHSLVMAGQSHNF